MISCFYEVQDIKILPGIYHHQKNGILMTKLIKKLKKISELKKQAILEEVTFFEHALKFQNALVTHLASKNFYTIRQGGYNQIAYIYIHISSYVFGVSLKPDKHQRSIIIEITEDSLKTKIKVKIKCYGRASTWVIRWISVRKCKYLMRTMKPEMIEEFLMIIADQL